MIVLRTPKGWTGPKEVDGLPAEGTLRSHQVPLAERADATPTTSRSSSSGCAPTGRRSCSTSTARCARSSPRWRRAGTRRMSANPHANGGLLLRDLELPDFRDYAVDGERRPATQLSEATRVLGALPARRDARQPRPLPHRRPRRDRLEPARRRVRGDRPRVGGRSCCPATTTSRPSGRVMEVLSEHLCQGWLEGYLLTGRHGLFNCYEAFIHIVDSMFNQHAKWLKVTREIPWRRADRLAQLPALLARLAPGPQRLLPPGPRLHRPRRQQEGGDRPRLPAAGRQLPAVGRRPLPAQPQLRQRDRRRQAARARLPDDGRGDRALHARDRHLGVGVQRRRRGARRRDGLRRRRPDARDARRGGDPARAAARAAGARRQRRRPDAPAARRASTRTASPTPSSTRSSRPTGR